MRILILASQLHAGAAELLAVDLAVNLNRLGVHAMVACMYSERMEWAASAKPKILQRGVPSVHFLGLPLHPTPLELLRAIARLRTILTRERVDILETSSPALGIIASLACTALPVWHVAGLHQTFYRSEHKSIRERMFAFCTRWRRKTAFYAVSQAVKNTWVAYSGTRESKTQVVYNSIAMSNIPTDPATARRKLRQELDIPEQTRIALSVGRLAAYKRQDFLVDALSPLCASKDLAIVFVGDSDLTVPGTRQMLERIEETIRKHALGSSVKFLGHRADVSELMTGADVLVHSTGKEAFGLVLAEAMAIGLPIVSTRVEGIPEVVAEPDNRLVPPDDPEAFRAAVLNVLERTPTQAEQVRVRNTARGRMYGPNARTEKMLALFRSLLPSHS
jgi:glycosyltransferase involved in cell wall biosynthesis